CPMCTNSFPIDGRGLYCTPRCRQRAYRLRHRQAEILSEVVDRGGGEERGVLSWLLKPGRPEGRPKRGTPHVENSRFGAVGTGSAQARSGRVGTRRGPAHVGGGAQS